MSLLRNFFEKLRDNPPDKKSSSKSNVRGDAGTTSSSDGLIDPFAEEENSKAPDNGKTPASGGLIDPFAEEESSKARHGGKKSKGSDAGKDSSSGGLINPFAEDNPAESPEPAAQPKKGAASPAPADDSMARAKKFFDEAERLYKKGQYAKAAESYRSAYQITKGEARGQLAFNVAQAYRLAKNPSSAAAWYQKALVLGGPGVAQYHDEIKARLDEMLTESVKDKGGEDIGMARVLFEEAEIAYADGDYAAAEAFYKQVYKDTKGPNMIFDIAQACRLGGKYAEAKSFYREYLRQVPDSPYKAEVEKHIEDLKKKVPDPPK